MARFSNHDFGFVLGNTFGRGTLQLARIKKIIQKRSISFLLLFYFFFWSFLLSLSKMSSSSIVVGLGMLWVWAGTVIVSQAKNRNESTPNDFCKKTTSCEVLKYNTCLGSPLPYTHTSLVLAEDSETQEEAFEKLAMWSGKTYSNKQTDKSMDWKQF